MRQGVDNLTVDLQHLGWERFAGRYLKSIKDKTKILKKVEEDEIRRKVHNFSPK